MAKAPGHDEKLHGSELPDLGDLQSVNQHSTSLHRQLGNRQIQLIAAGGSIGTALFISIGSSLAKGGPASLLIAFTLYTAILALVNNSAAELNTYMPVAGGFVRHAGYWFDDALGFVAGWNFFLYEVFLIPFEITALSFCISFWTDKSTDVGPTVGICLSVIVLYAMLNFAAVQFYGEAEFWLSGGKVLLIFILFAFTLFTMSGANPQHDAYGFRHFSSPSPFATYLSEGPLGRLEGFVACLSNAAITIVGPEYISMIAAEAKHPSIYVKSAYETVYYRFCAFFILGALSVGIILRCDDKALRETWLGGGDTGSASASPYVLAMSNMGIGVLPHIVNALILTSIFSAGNTYIYSATRALYSLALEGRAPRALRYCNSRGIPVYCFLVVMLFPFLSFLQVANSSATVLTFLAGLITSGILVNFIVISLTFLNYYRACQVQSVDRTQRPYYGRFQPYGSYIALVCQVIILFGCGYTAFRPKWDAKLFIQNYGMPILDSILFVGWKLMKKTSLVRPADMDLIWERPGIDAYEQLTTEPVVSLWTEILQLFGFRRHPGRDAEIATAR